jgi:hypothetical protein
VSFFFVCRGEKGAGIRGIGQENRRGFVIDLFVSVYTTIIARRKEANRIIFLWGCGEKTTTKKEKEKTKR